MSNSKHPAGDLLQAFHDGELDLSKAAEIENHCRQCASCTAELTELSRMDHLITSVQAPELPHTVWPQVKPASADESRLRIPLTIAACAAGLAVGILLGPIQLHTSKTISDSIGSQSVTLWDSGTTSSLISVHQSGLE